MAYRRPLVLLAAGLLAAALQGGCKTTPHVLTIPSNATATITPRLPTSVAPPQSESARLIVQRSAEAMSAVRSFHSESSQHMTVATDVVDYGVAIDLVLPDAYYGTITGAGQEIDILGRGTDAYLRVAGGKWMSYEEAVGVGLGDLGLSAEAFANQAAGQLAIAAAAEDLVLIGTSEADGAAVDRIRATVSGDQLAGALQEQLGGSGLISDALGSLGGSIVYELHIGRDDGLLRRVETTMDVEIEGIAVQGQSTIRLSQFNEVGNLPAIPPE
jgi:hypothetical protein